MRVTRYDYQGRLDGVTRTPQGGIRATANLTRTGIFRYYDSDGEPFHELRPADEVFKADSLKTIDTAPLTVGHPSEVNASNWRDLAVGHVIAGTVRENGKFVTADIAIQDGETASKVESGELRELSMGYEVDLDLTPGEHEGERFDAIQRNPRYNHVAIGGTDWGRAGRDVRVYLDSEKCLCGLPSLDAMNVKRTDAPAGTPVQRTDAPAGTPPTNTQTQDAADGLRRDLDASRADNDRLRAERDAALKRADTAEAERDAAKNTLTEHEKQVKVDKEAFETRVEDRVKLITDAKPILDEKDKPFDFKGKSDKDIRIAVLTKVDPKFDAKDKRDGYIEARFDLAVPAVKKDQEELAEVNEVVTTPDTHEDANESPVDKARREMNERHLNAWKPKK